jgi:hypothetical protein
MKESILRIERFLYTARTSIGSMYFCDEALMLADPSKKLKAFAGYSLEDTARPGNVKVYGETCLPGGLRCRVSLFENAHYGKTIIFHTEPDGFTIKYANLKWTYCLLHNGINFEHTEGCVLAGGEYVKPVYSGNKIIQEPVIKAGSGLKDVIRQKVEARIAAGYEVWAEFVNLDFIK